MNVGLDTSVVLRILVGEPVDLARVALRELTHRMSEGHTAYISDLVATETYHALQFHYGVPKDKALAILHAFVSKSGVRCLGSAGDVLSMPGLATSNPGFVDRMIHAEYGRADADLLTFEKAAGRLPRAQVLTA